VSLNEEVELLRNIPLFANIEPSKLKLLAFTSERVAYDPGQELFHQGDDGDAAYIIIGGEADIIIETDNGPFTVATFKRNDIVGEIAILCDVPRTATVSAASEVVALRIAKERFFTLLDEFPEMAVEMLRELARRLEVTTVRLREAHAKLGGAAAE
jgi:CRP-like cAMP-binding protein